MSYDTSSGRPTVGLTYAKMIDHLREAQECAAMLAHLTRANGDTSLGSAWMGVAELLRRIAAKVTELAQGRLN